MVHAPLFNRKENELDELLRDNFGGQKGNGSPSIHYSSERYELLSNQQAGWHIQDNYITRDGFRVRSSGGAFYTLDPERFSVLDSDSIERIELLEKENSLFMSQRNEALAALFGAKSLTTQYIPKEEVKSFMLEFFNRTMTRMNFSGHDLTEIKVEISKDFDATISKYLNE